MREGYSNVTFSFFFTCNIHYKCHIVDHCIITIIAVVHVWMFWCKMKYFFLYLYASQIHVRCICKIILLCKNIVPTQTILELQNQDNHNQIQSSQKLFSSSIAFQCSKMVHDQQAYFNVCHSTYCTPVTQ